ncbi:MAG: helix-hairpin-helix domain-containing protein [Cytophagales bacterium]|nr:helix-hairpin-helix domain-containing protein [Cytophagales bacterium]
MSDLRNPFNTKQIRGMLVFGLLMLAYACLLYWRPIHLLKKDPVIAETDRKLDSLVAVLKTRKENRKKSWAKKAPAELWTADALKAFDPNKDELETLIAKGLNKKFAQRIINFREKARPFREKKDFRKLYGLTDSSFLLIAPYLLLPEKAAKNIPKKRSRSIARHKTFPKKPVFKEAFAINKADSLLLVSLKGIGGYSALRILRYRKQLGGFVDTAQYNEIPKLAKEAVQSLKKHTFVTQNFIPRKILVNQATFKEFLRHPYIDYTTTRKIFKLKKRAGRLDSYRMMKKYIPSLNPRLKQYFDTLQADSHFSPSKRKNAPEQ